MFRQQLSKYADGSLQGKTVEKAILPAASALNPGGIVSVSVQVPINNCFFVYCSLVGLEDESLIGLQS